MMQAGMHPDSALTGARTLLRHVAAAVLPTAVCGDFAACDEAADVTLRDVCVVASAGAGR